MAETKNFVTLTNLGYFKQKQDAFNAATYVPLTQKGVANGVATLDANGLVPAAQLPSYVDDVLEFATLDNFPTEGEAGKIYVDQATGKIYRWSGSAYINISSAVSTADEAVKLATARKINGVDFDGTADITINAEDATPRIATSEKAAANGVATLDANTKVPVAQLPLATASAAGAVTVGNNLTLTDGEVNVPVATDSVKGIVATGDNITNTNGVISVAKASASVYGVAKAGTNIDAADGVFSVPAATANAQGAVQVGANISVNDGTISLAKQNVIDALGYTPFDAANEVQLEGLTNAEIDGLFSA
jgi:hypothetical protein